MHLRSNVRIRVTDELIRVTTNDTGTFMNTGQPLELRSTETFEGELKRVLRYLFIRIKGSKLSYEGTLGVKLYNWTKIPMTITPNSLEAVGDLLLCSIDYVLNVPSIANKINKMFNPSILILNRIRQINSDITNSDSNLLFNNRQLLCIWEISTCVYLCLFIRIKQIMIKPHRKAK